MMGSWQNGLLIFLRTASQILAAGVAITAFSLLLYALTFNLRDRVARSFALILLCVVIVFTAEAIGSATTTPGQAEFWLRLQWVGIIFLPPTYLQFADALLATTGRPSRGKRTLTTWLSYIISALFLAMLPFSALVGPLATESDPAPYLQPTLLTTVFILFYGVVMVMAWYLMVRAYQRTTTATSRRRMAYLMIGALAPALGSFPYLLFSANFAARHSLIFWMLSTLANFLLGGLVVVMAYAVAFFGVPWPDRVVRARLFKWIMRGPVTASVTLGFVTVTRRAGAVFGQDYTALVPIVMVATILLMEHLISLVSPFWERVLFSGNDRTELDLINGLADRLVTRNDLQQFLEMLLAAVRDRLQARGAFITALNDGGMEMVVNTGQTSLVMDADISDQLIQATQDENLPRLFQWGEDFLVPLVNESDSRPPELLGLLGISGVTRQSIDDEQMQSLMALADRATEALRDRRIQHQLVSSLETLTPQMEMLQRMRAAGSYAGSSALNGASTAEQYSDLTLSVKDALTHYWGGPKLTQSPLMRLRVVRDALETHEGNEANALRAILRAAIERVRPEGDRRFTGEWILYNILDMKFLEGRKVREIALRLAMSEADLYRKQRIAIESVAKALVDMEAEAREETPNGMA